MKAVFNGIGIAVLLLLIFPIFIVLLDKWFTFIFSVLR